MRVSVDDYGTTGDGVTDDRPAIQAAINTGGVVEFTAGKTYATNGSLVIDSPVNLTGYGATIRAQSGGTALRISSSDVTVEGLTIIGNGADEFRRSERGILSLGTPETPFTGCRIADVTVRDMGDTSIRVDWWTDSLITGCRLENQTYAGIFAQSCTRLRITRTLVKDVWRHDADQAYGISITDSTNTVEGQSRDCTVDHCTIINNAHWTGLSTHGGARIVFRSNLVTQCHRGITFVAGNPTRVVTATDGVAIGNTIDGTGSGGSVGMAVIGQYSGAESTVYESGNLVYNHARAFEASTNGRWLDAPPSFYAPGKVAHMPALETKVDGQWVQVAAGRDGKDGPQGAPGPASPREGSHIATSVRAWGATGDGTTDDTEHVQDAIEAAAGTYADFEAGTYLVTDNLGMDFWRARKAGPGVITDGAGNEFRISPRSDADVNTIWVHGTDGSDDNDGISPERPLRTLAALDEVLGLIGPDTRGQWQVRLSGEFEGHRFADLPHTRLPLLIEGDPLIDGEPVTTIRRVTAQIGIHVQPAVGRTVTFRNLAFKDFTSGSGFGMLWAQGGSVRVENCLAEDCGTGFAMRDNVNMSVLDTTVRRCTTSGFRSQYFANGAWTRCTATDCQEGFHVSRNSVMHVDYCVAEDSNRNGLWLDMAARCQAVASTFRRNAWHGIRGEGNSTVDVNQTTAGGNIFGTGADANGIKDVSVMGGAVLAVDEGIYAIPEHLTATKVGSWTTAVTADRGLRDYRIGRDARMRIRVWGTDGGSGKSLAIQFGSTSIHTRNLTTNQWMVEVTLLYSGNGWQGVATLNGAGNEFPVIDWPSGEAKPSFVPTGATIRGYEVYVGG